MGQSMIFPCGPDSNPCILNLLSPPPTCMTTVQSNQICGKPHCQICQHLITGIDVYICTYIY